MSTASLSPTDLSGLRIAIANWRDPWHPQAGGAERYAWEMARGLTAAGAEVHFLTARASGSGSPGNQGRDQDRQAGRPVHRVPGDPRLAAGAPPVLRRGARLPERDPVLHPARAARRVPVLCVVHHVHTAQFGVHFRPWMASLGRLLEGPAARLVYRRHACVAVSPSTVTAMRQRLALDRRHLPGPERSRPAPGSHRGRASRPDATTPRLGRPAGRAQAGRAAHAGSRAAGAAARPSSS